MDYSVFARPKLEASGVGISPFLWIPLSAIETMLFAVDSAICEYGEKDEIFDVVVLKEEANFYVRNFIKQQKHIILDPVTDRALLFPLTADGRPKF